MTNPMTAYVTLATLVAQHTVLQPLPEIPYTDVKVGDTGYLDTGLEELGTGWGHDVHSRYFVNLVADVRHGAAVHRTAVCIFQRYTHREDAESFLDVLCIAGPGAKYLNATLEGYTFNVNNQRHLRVLRELLHGEEVDIRDPADIEAGLDNVLTMKIVR